MEKTQLEAKNCLLNIQVDQTQMQFRPYHLLLEKVEKNAKNRANSAKIFTKKTFISESHNCFSDVNLKINIKQTLKNTLKKLQQKQIQTSNSVSRRIKTVVTSSCSKVSPAMKQQQEKTVTLKPKRFIESNTYGVFSEIPNFQDKLKILFKNKKNIFQDQNEEIRKSIKRKLSQKQQKSRYTVESKIDKITSFLNQNKDNFFETKKNRIYKAFSERQELKTGSRKANKQNQQKTSRSYMKKLIKDEMLENRQKNLPKMGRYGSRKLTNILY